MGTIWNGFVVALESVLRFFFDLTHSAGFAIILFTLALKLILLPLTLRQLRSSREMQRLQPKVRELQKRYSKDREKMNAELMKLYREYGVNPMSGCLPSLVQLPIFFGVYYAVLNLSRTPSLTALLSRWVGFQAAGITGIDVRAGLTPGILANQPFLWMNSMGNPDPWHVLPILAGVFQLIQQRMMTPRDGDPQQASMSNAMMFMPLMIVFIGWNFPAGPVLYWVTQSIVSVVIQYFISGWGALTDWLPFLPERKQPELKPRPKAVQVDDAPARSRGFFGRLMDRMATMQEELAAQQNATDEQEDEPGVEQGEELPPAPSKRRSRR